MLTINTNKVESNNQLNHLFFEIHQSLNKRHQRARYLKNYTNGNNKVTMEDLH